MRRPGGSIDALTRLGYNQLQANVILDLTVGRRTAQGRQHLADELRSAREFLDQHQGE